MGQAGEKAGEESGRRFGIRFNKRLGGGFSASTGIARKAAGGIAAAFAAVQVAGFLKDAIDEAREAAKVTRITEAAIRSTGGAAHVTARDVDRLATALSNKTAVDDEAIATSSDLLLTFVNIRNETGKGRDVFNQAQTAIVDMTAAMNGGEVTAQGLKASTIQVGKALNDPIKGMTALSRVGVAFTKGQKDQITAMVEAGDRMGAQRLILAELRKEFGGAAAAAADPWQRFGVVMGNLKEQIGTALLPVLTQVADFLADRLPGALAFVGRALRPVFLGFRALQAAFSGGGITTEASSFVGVMERIGVVLRGIVIGALGFLRRNLETIQRILPAVAAGFTALLVVGSVAKVMGLVAAGIRAIGVAVAANPLGLLLTAAVVVGAGLAWFFRNTETGRRVLQTLWTVAKTLAAVFVREIAPAVASATQAFVSGLLPGLKTLWRMVQTQLWPILKALAIVIGAVLYVALTKVLPILLRLAGPVLGFLIGTIAKLIGWVTNIIRWIAQMGAAFLRWITGTKNTGDAIRRLADTAKAQFAFIARMFLNLVGGIITGAAKAFGWVPGLGPKLRTAADQFRVFKDRVNAQLDGLKSKKVTVTATFGINTGNTQMSVHDIVGATGGYVTSRAIVPRRLHRGGLLDGPGTETSDSIPARLSKGEYVVRAKAVRAVGRDAMDWINAQGFAAGGGVDLDTQIANPRVFARALGRFEGVLDRSIRRLADRFDRAVGQGRPGVQAFIRSTDRLDYGWGGAGPNVYDCSGIVGAAHLAHLGRPYGHGQRLYTTSTIRAGIAGLKPGLGGVLQIGVTPGRGHMAGRYAGLGFEAESTRTGIKIGGAASRPESFARHYHLAKGGLVERFPWLIGADIGGDEGRLRINGKVLDAGGWLMPGQVGVNLTRTPERVLGPGESAVNLHVELNFSGPVIGDTATFAREITPQIRRHLKDQLRREGKIALASQL